MVQGSERFFEPGSAARLDHIYEGLSPKFLEKARFFWGSPWKLLGATRDPHKNSREGALEV